MHAQFRRAKEREDTSDAELYNDLLFVHNKSTESDVDPAILSRLAEKLQLLTISDLKQESLALHEMAIASGGDPGNVIEKMVMLLKKFKDFMQTQDPEMGPLAKLNAFSPNGKSETPRLPDDFRCPISLDLMKDPVIVATGQVFDPYLFLHFLIQKYLHMLTRLSIYLIFLCNLNFHICPSKN